MSKKSKPAKPARKVKGARAEVLWMGHQKENGWLPWVWGLSREYACKRLDASNGPIRVRDGFTIQKVRIVPLPPKRKAIK